MMKKACVFIDGVFSPAEPSLLDSLTPGRMPGRGVFETLRADRGKLFAWPLHWARLKEGLRKTRIACPYRREEIEKALKQCLRANRSPDARLRLIVWKSERRVHVAIVARAYQPFSPGRYARGWKVLLIKNASADLFRRPRIKSLQYLPYLRAYQQAKKRGADEAVWVNRKGELVEGSRTNVFVVKGGALFTPALKCGCLKGITRQIVLRLAKEMKIPCRESVVSPRDLLDADEAFLTNAVIGLIPLTFVGKKSVGRGYSVITSRLWKGYSLLRKAGSVELRDQG